MGMSMQLKGCDFENPVDVDLMSWLAQVIDFGWSMWMWCSWMIANMFVLYGAMMTVLCVTYWFNDAWQLGLFRRLDSHARWLRLKLFFEPLLGLCRGLVWCEIYHRIRKFTRDGQERAIGDAMTALTKAAMP